MHITMMEGTICWLTQISHDVVHRTMTCTSWELPACFLWNCNNTPTDWNIWSCFCLDGCQSWFFLHKACTEWLYKSPVTFMTIYNVALSRQQCWWHSGIILLNLQSQSTCVYATNSRILQQNNKSNNNKKTAIFGHISVTFFHCKYSSL